MIPNSKHGNHKTIEISNANLEINHMCDYIGLREFVFCFEDHRQRAAKGTYVVSEVTNSMQNTLQKICSPEYFVAQKYKYSCYFCFD